VAARSPGHSLFFRVRNETCGRNVFVWAQHVGTAAPSAGSGQAPGRPRSAVPLLRSDIFLASPPRFCVLRTESALAAVVPCWHGSPLMRPTRILFCYNFLQPPPSENRILET